MSTETRETKLHDQLQEGLCYEIMESSAVLGATQYSERCLTARNEEKRQHELAKCRQLNKWTRQVMFQDAPALNHPRTNLGIPLSLDSAHVLRLSHPPLPAAIIAICLATYPEISKYLTMGVSVVIGDPHLCHLMLEGSRGILWEHASGEDTRTI